MKITIEYYGKLQHTFNTNEEQFEVDATTVLEIFNHLCKWHNVELSTENIRPAINDHFAEWNDACQNNDTLAFLPPAAGG